MVLSALLDKIGGRGTVAKIGGNYGNKKTKM